MKYIAVIICGILLLIGVNTYTNFQESKRYFENKEKQREIYDDNFSSDASVESLCKEYFYEYSLFSTTEIIEHYSNAGQLYGKITDLYGDFSVCDPYQEDAISSTKPVENTIVKSNIGTQCILNGVSYSKPDNSYCVTDSSVHAWYCNQGYYESGGRCIYGERPVSKKKQNVIYTQPLLLPQRGLPSGWKQEN